MRKNRIVFIGGLHKSGTTLLSKCLAAHSDISGFRNTGVPRDEGQHLQSVYPRAWKFGGPGRFALHPESYENETSSLVSEDSARKLWSEWAKYWDLDKTVLLEKSPPNLIRGRFLQALFPNAYFIMLLRHPIAVSYATQKWQRRMPLRSLIEHWLISHERFDADRGFLRNLKVFKYEDFIAKPQDELDKIYSFLGLAAEPITFQVRSDIQEKYLAKWRKKLTGRFSRSYANGIVARFERRINRFGYSLTEF